MITNDDKKDKRDKESNNYDLYSEPESMDGERDLSSFSANVSVAAKPGESAESLLRRFREKVKESGVLEKLEELRFYVRPSQRKKYEQRLRQQKIRRTQKTSN